MFPDPERLGARLTQSVEHETLGQFPKEEEKTTKGTNNNIANRSQNPNTGHWDKESVYQIMTSYAGWEHS